MNRRRGNIWLEFNSFYIAGARDVHIPAAVRGASLATNRHCINVGCRMWRDGGVGITLGLYGELEPAGALRLDWRILTPDLLVLLFDANNPELMQLPVTTTNTRIRVWTNHPAEPDEVAVVVGGE